MSRNSKFLVSKHIKVMEFFQKPKTFLNRGIRHNKNYMQGPNSKNTNIKNGGSP